jgi:dihydroneopterin aldolase
MDAIRLTGVRGYGYHGVHPEEREQGQSFVVDVVLTLDLTEAAARDDLGATVHYGHLAREVVAAIEGPPVDLIETLAEHIADLALRRDRVRTATVTVHKPEAPIAVPFGDVAVSVERSAPASPARAARRRAGGAPT